MRHFEIDQYARESPLSTFDPRVKLASSIALIIALAFIREPVLLLLISIFLGALVLLSRVPISHFARHLAFALPFIAFAAVAMSFTSGMIPAVVLSVRIIDSVAALLVLVMTTPFFDLLKAMRWFKVPWIISSLILFTYRFIFVFIEEMETMKLARRSRGFTGKGSIFSRDVLKTLAFSIGMILVRSNKRASNIYSALLSRGWDGEVRTLNKMRVKLRDAALASAFVIVSLFALGIQIGVLHWTL